MDILDNKEKICVRCDLPKTGQKADNNNIAPEHVNGEGNVSVPDALGAQSGNGERLPVRQEEDRAAENIGQAANLLSEDEISSNSDDCVYTYRGGHLEAPMRVPQETLVDDTDFLEFLEMDFDPEPSSEQDNYPENSYLLELDGFIANLQENHPLTATFNGIHSLDKPPILLEDKSLPIEVQDLTDKPPDNIQTDKLQRNTGAKPKLTQTTNSTVKQKKSPPIVPNDPDPPRADAQRHKEVCLECSELEFLSETSQNPMKQSRKCTKHAQERSRTPPELSTSAWDSDIAAIQSAGRQVPHRESRNLLTLNLDLPAGQDKVVKLSSVGCTEEDVVECLSTLGVKVNQTVLKEHFEGLTSEEMVRQMDLTEFILHIAKLNCDYHKLIDAIRAACEKSAQDLHFSFEPSKKVPEMIKVNLTDIAIRWNPNASLRDLINLPNKYFHTFNVVGKIANAVRQLNTPDESDKCDHILVPNFYKSGFVVISRRK
ncbi:uncharacterized protein LOC129807622 [Phlebotomus papatasi]|uniref:uncharacterized protein LOC129807622 n=1 Tax=Phlebotomus papatasi TaxID=29031 RepID=UPI0024837BAB|nr:uncharacterized protein LOC129807622 [Phlebotomus papatasi]